MTKGAANVQYAERIGQLTPFKAVDFLEAAIALQAQGRDIVRMETGEPKFPTAAPIAEAAARAITEDHTRYTPACGIPELREAISELYEARYGLSVSPQRVVVTTGSSAALGLLCELLLNPGDGLLLADPGYPCNANFVRRVGAQPQAVPVNAEQNFLLHAELIARYWQENTRGAIVASPGNPTGSVFAREELQALWQALKDRGGVWLSDEIYHGLTYAEMEETCALSITEDACVINSFSKYFGMTGWRLGWMVVPEAAVESVNLMAQNYFISNPSIAQYAALAALAPQTREILDQRREELQDRRDFLVAALRGLGFGIGHVPLGGFYLYADISRFADDSEPFCWRLLNEYGVACTPGTDFGRHRANSYIRFSYVEPMERLREGVARLERMVADSCSG